MANKYWFGGSGTWNATNTANWSLNSGGPTVTAVPGATDTVIFDGNSGGGTVTVSGTRVCGNFTSTNFTGIITGNATSVIQVSGKEIILGELEIFDPTNTPTLSIAVNGEVTLKSSGQTVGNISITSLLTTLTLLDDLVTFNNSTLSVLGGTFNANGKNVFVGTVTDGNSGSAKTINMGSGTWTLTLGGPTFNPGVVWSITQPSTLTLNTQTSKIRLLKHESISRLRSPIPDATTSTINMYGYLQQGGTLSYWPTSGTVLVEDELISYTGVTVVNANYNVTLTGCSRGLLGTTATAHTTTGTAVLRMTPFDSTTLTTIISDGTTIGTINVSDSTPFDANGGTLLIDNEILQFGSKPSSTSLSITARAASTFGDIATPHDAGSPVYITESRRFIDTVATTRSYPPIEVWSRSNYQITNFIGGTNPVGGIDNVKINTIFGPQQVLFNTGTQGTYYDKQPFTYGSSDLLAFFTGLM